MPGHPCAKGCYNCLLSYGNQLVHELIDRHAARSLLLAISQGETVPAGPGVSRTDHSIKLIGQADSTLEAEFIRWLKDNGYRLPDAAQQTVRRHVLPSRTSSTGAATSGPRSSSTAPPTTRRRWQSAIRRPSPGWRTRAGW